MELRNDRRRLPRAARRVLSARVGADGSGWAEEYWLSRSADHRAWVLWITWFDHDAGRVAISNVGSCPRNGNSREAAALELLGAHWEARRDRWDADAPRATAGGILSTDRIEKLTERIWPRQAQEA